jgi:hypothetical protein
MLGTSLGNGPVTDRTIAPSPSEVGGYCATEAANCAAVVHTNVTPTGGVCVSA